ncbi:MAG: NERD domain-containing protein [Actinobacteria bacterium]|nr:NERD domain-containing protein [Actinomycetota bacterium]
MGTVVPEDFPLSSLANEAERRVVEAFRDRLGDRWLVLPTVQLRTDQRDYEIDVVLLHEELGLVVIEVKGHRVEVRDGLWRHQGRPMEPQPMDQARRNAYALRDRLIQERPDLDGFRTTYGVALPNTAAYDGQLPIDTIREQILTAPEIDDPMAAIETLALARWTSRPLTAGDVEAIVAILRPDLEFRWDPTARHRASRDRLDELCATQVQALERLDVNRRVVALGRAGTGKTRLATTWANRAFARGERVLLTCYNEPLAARVAEQLVDDESLRVGPFLRLALGLEGMAPLEVPADADHEWWTVTAVGHLHAHWHRIVERFDTIVVDEAQDFSPAWLAQLEALLDPDGPRRILLAADPAQELYTRGFQVPAVDDGWTRCELVSNCRNSHRIASLLRRALGGAAAPAVAPEGSPVRFVPLAFRYDLPVLVRGELERLVQVEGLPASDVAVLTFSSQTRDQLVAELDLRRWEGRDTGILCENVHRVKGLEADTVILATDADEVPDDLLYVGISRAVSELVIVAPPPVGTRLKLLVP